ncbi:adenylate/guanylate cyclase domain-containing protein [Azospirillum halopraeferens]|uniref:adenylate/guanylate cyclase domain-containing protein n=1 Tax=Azospirillum halopraeferens TaxID=34010 RepID=UPI000408BC9A|nr:adenylate/guanylate cyclase domain-containing protein [Azospirillum halopraeferens]
METGARALFDAAEVRAERTVAGLRIAVAVLLFLAFAAAVLSNAPHDRTELTRQIAVALGSLAAYFTFGVMTLRLAGSAAYRPWMGWAFATLDLVFVAVNVMISVDNTGVPSNYAAAFPAVWLMPLVLAFGALRYNPYLQAYLVVLTGLGVAATIGFGALPGGADRPPPAALSLFFGAPPNVMRGVMVVLAGAVLVLAAHRARTLLRRAIAETRRRANLTRFLPPQIADRLADGSEAELRRGRRQTAAVLFTDVRGFTERAEVLDPEALGAFVNGLRACVARAAGRTGGVIDKFVGDSAMVVFGVPAPGPDDAGRALACARALLAEVEAWNALRAAAGEDAVRIGIGVHWGEVFCGAVGDDTRLEFTVLGDTVNVAARVEQTTKTAGHALIVTRELLDAAGEDPAGGGWTALPAAPLRGRHSASRLYGAVGAPAPVPG